jgi:PTH1 family peptidyl-tRNA hydrolase
MHTRAVSESSSKMDLAAYVLGHFNPEEKPIINDSIRKSVEAIDMLISSGVEKSMNIYNRKS